VRRLSTRLLTGLSHALKRGYFMHSETYAATLCALQSSCTISSWNPYVVGLRGQAGNRRWASPRCFDTSIGGNDDLRIRTWNDTRRDFRNKISWCAETRPCGICVRQWLHPVLEFKVQPQAAAYQCLESEAYDSDTQSAPSGKPAWEICRGRR
jgi:hypothetical protein